MFNEHFSLGSQRQRPENEQNITVKKGNNLIHGVLFKMHIKAVIHGKLKTLVFGKIDEN